MDSSGFEPEASSMPRKRSSADLRAPKTPKTKTPTTSLSK